MKHTIDFKIVTPEKIVYQDEISQATVPTASGEITVLANHSPLVSVLKTGEMIVKKQQKENGRKFEDFYFAIFGGIVEVRPGSQVIVLADRAERAEEIDLERANEARKRAEKALSEKDKLDDRQYAKLQAILEKEINRINIRRRRFNK
jgi:F-type H+-transporting ATPase subunit epsilon